MWQTLSKEETLRNLKSNEKKGLSKDEVEKRSIKYGKNKLKDKPKESLIIKFLKQFNDFMIIILIIASIISAVISNIQGENDYIDSIIIIAIVILNAIMGVIQEAKAEKERLIFAAFQFSSGSTITVYPSMGVSLFPFLSVSHLIPLAVILFYKAVGTNLMRLYLNFAGCNNIPE